MQGLVLTQLWRRPYTLLTSEGERSLWTAHVQIKRGLGTSIPMLPPEKLLMNGPYRYCRNPMAFGGYIYYFGINCIIGSPSAFFIVIWFVIILTIIIKIGEEPDVEKRFGQACTKYKRETPFLIPKISGKRWYFFSCIRSRITCVCTRIARTSRYVWVHFVLFDR